MDGPVEVGGRVGGTDVAAEAVQVALLGVAVADAFARQSAVGPVQFGRRLYQGAYGEYADGRLSDVRLYPTALPPADAAAPGGNATLTQLD
ncbi:hypothetical protein [Streptomyces mirabilis]